jgi:hypothetical protein
MRAANVEAGTVEDMGVDHSGGDILVAEQLLNGANIVAVLQQMCGKTVPPRKSFAHAVGVSGFLWR